MNDTLPTLNRRRALALFGDDTGAATAEYAITTIGPVSRVTRSCRLSSGGSTRRAPR